MAKQTGPPAIGKTKQGVFRRSEDSYQIRMMVNGKRNYAYASDYQAAVLLAQEARQKRSQGRMTGRNELVGELFKQNSRIALGDLIDKYIAVKTPGLKPLTVRFYEGTKKHFKSIASLVVADITLTAISKFTAELQEQELSNKTINHALNLIRSACTLAVREQWIEKNPFANVENLKVDKHEPDPFSKEELVKIFANLDEHLLPYFLLQAATGLRTGELFALKWKDIDYRHNQIRISKSRWRNIEKSTKTAGSQRTVFIPEDIKQMLQDLQKQRKATNEAPLVVNKSGEPYQIYLHKYWKKALKDAKVPYRPNYVLRSTYASLSLQQGADLGYISKALGHTSIKMTADKYLRYLKDADKANKDKVTQMMADMSLTAKHPGGGKGKTTH